MGQWTHRLRTRDRRIKWTWLVLKFCSGTVSQRANRINQSGRIQPVKEFNGGNKQKEQISQSNPPDEINRVQAKGRDALAKIARILHVSHIQLPKRIDLLTSSFFLPRHLQRQRQRNRWYPRPLPNSSERTLQVQAAIIIHPNKKNTKTTQYSHRQLIKKALSLNRISHHQRKSRFNQHSHHQRYRLCQLILQKERFHCTTQHDPLLIQKITH